jgi:hypothetical protein
MLQKFEEDILTRFNISNQNRRTITPLNRMIEVNYRRSVFGSGDTSNYFWDCKTSNRRTDFKKVSDAVENNINIEDASTEQKQYKIFKNIKRIYGKYIPLSSENIKSYTYIKSQIDYNIIILIKMLLYNLTQTWGKAIQSVYI